MPPEALRGLDYGDVERLFKNGRIIKEGSKQKVHLCDLKGHSFIVKSYEALGVFPAFRALIRRSRPHNSMRYATYLRAHGVSCAEHFLIVTRYRFRSAKSYLVMEYISGRKLRDFFFCDKPLELSEETAQAALNNIRLFHKLGLTHGDLHVQNLLVENETNVRLIDFDNVGKSRSRQHKDISRLKMSIANGNQNTRFFLKMLEEQLLR
jgi:tRNA A-37 threonylcarbamoyl transferase component Bud32